MRDDGQLAGWLREAADELYVAHALLDDLGVPREVYGDGIECTLAARIALALSVADPLGGEE